MTAMVTPKVRPAHRAGAPVAKEMESPQDVGRAVAMLARGDLPYSTGQVIVIDGGLTAPRL